MAAWAAEACGARADEALVMSTGVIGAMLPMEKIRAGIADSGRRARHRRRRRSNGRPAA